MKVAVVVVLAVLGFAAADLTFEEFVQTYNKPYALDATEYARRQAIFQSNVQAINVQRLALLKAGEQPWMGINQFTDMTAEEFKNSGRIQKKSLGVDARSCLAKGVTLDESKVNVAAAPAAFDWRDKNVVSPIQDQGQCGSCWTFSTIAVIESAYAIKTNSTPIKLSEQEIVDCSHGCVKEDGQDVCNQGCNGGWMWSALEDIISWKGEEKETEYPYTATTDTCKRKNDSGVEPISNYTCLSGPKLANETVMAAFLAENGPLSIAMDAGILQTYTSGIINPKPTDCSKVSLDHAIVIVGYGADAGKDFWIVRNSWGLSWGEKGYFRIVRGHGACGLNAGVVFPNI